MQFKPVQLNLDQCKPGLTCPIVLMISLAYYIQTYYATMHVHCTNQVLSLLTTMSCDGIGMGHLIFLVVQVLAFLS